MKKRIICLMLAAVMLFSLLPMTALAADAELSVAAENGSSYEAELTVKKMEAKDFLEKIAKLFPDDEGVRKIVEEQKEKIDKANDRFEIITFANEGLLRIGEYLKQSEKGEEDDHPLLNSIKDRTLDIEIGDVVEVVEAKRDELKQKTLYILDRIEEKYGNRSGIPTLINAARSAVNSASDDERLQNDLLPRIAKLADRIVIVGAEQAEAQASETVDESLVGTVVEAAANSEKVRSVKERVQNAVEVTREAIDILEDKIVSTAKLAKEQIRRRLKR